MIGDLVKELGRYLAQSHPGRNPGGSWIVWIHGELLFLFFVFVYCALNIFVPDENDVTCSSLGGNLAPLRDPVRYDLCLSYSYTSFEDTDGDKMLYHSKYRYIPAFIVVCFAILYTIKLISNAWTDKRLETFFHCVNDLTEREIVKFFVDYAPVFRTFNELRRKMVGYVVLTSAANLYLLQFVSERTFFENVPYMFGGHDAKRMEAMY